MNGSLLPHGHLPPAVVESSQTSDRWRAVGEMFYQHQICPSLHLTLDLQIANGDDLDCLNLWPACALVFLFGFFFLVQLAMKI